MTKTCFVTFGSGVLDQRSKDLFRPLSPLSLPSLVVISSYSPEVGVSMMVVIPSTVLWLKDNGLIPSWWCIAELVVVKILQLSVQGGVLPGEGLRRRGRGVGRVSGNTPLRPLQAVAVKAQWAELFLVRVRARVVPGHCHCEGWVSLTSKKLRKQNRKYRLEETMAKKVVVTLAPMFEGGL